MAKKILLAILAVFLMAMVAHNSFPGIEGSDPWEQRPNDPSYDDMWQLFSHVPLDQRRRVSDWDAEHGSGMSVDKAWQLHTGNQNTVIAILDSGIRWSDQDLLENHYLNQRELPLPEGSDVYDANGDGRFSVSDYLEDSRVSDTNDNGKIDPEDLIVVFSDGVDDDANGFTDDISGWDFHEMDNNPGDRTEFGHGTGEARDSAGGLNNGVRRSGICGECRFVSIRLNDSFIVDAQTFAAGVRYAHTMQVDLIQQALGGINHTDDVSEAVNAAYDDGIIIIGSAADEHSYHHNYPSTIDPIVYTNAVRHDAMDFRDATTFVNFNNCSNFGARVDVATAGRSCSSEATGNLSGIAALAISYAKSLGRPIAPGNLISLIKTTADDINFGLAEDDSDRFSTFEGWDTMTGYGRTNAYTILRAIRDERVPAEARIKSPQWFELVENTRSELSVIIDARSATAGRLQIQLDAARGVELAEDEFTPVYEVQVTNEALDYEIRVPLARLEKLARGNRDHPRNEYAYTVRLRVREAGKPMAEARRTFFVHPDSDVNLWTLEGSGEPGGMFADLNVDGRDEWITVNGEGYVSARTVEGELPGFPVLIAESRHGRGGPGVFAPPAAGDLNRDGRPEVVVLSTDGHIAVVQSDGTALPGFPILVDRPDPADITEDQVISAGFMTAPTLVDMDGDDYLDVVAVGLDGKVYVYNYRGESVAGFPLEIAVDGIRAKILSSPAVADLDGDSRPDLVFGTNHVGRQAGYLFAISGATRSLLSTGFPTRIPLIRDDTLPTVGQGIPTSPIIADFDLDGELEVFVHGFAGKAYLVDRDGRLERSFTMDVGVGHATNDDRMVPAFASPALARWNDSYIPIGLGVGRRMLVALLLGGKRYEFQHMLTGWDPLTGQMLENFPQQIDDMTLGMSAVAADFDLDGNDEVLASSGGYFIRAYNQAGRFPSLDKFTGGWAIRPPALGDFDGDGRWDIGITTREGYSLVWQTGAEKTTATWPTLQGNNLRQGTFNIPRKESHAD